MDVTVVRIYLTESEGKLERLMRRLHDEEPLRGVTVFRGISGFGPSGRMHASHLVDMSLDLPLVVEFFDRPDRVATVIQDIKDLVEPGRLLTWAATSNIET